MTYSDLNWDPLLNGNAGSWNSLWKKRAPMRNFEYKFIFSRQLPSTTRSRGAITSLSIGTIFNSQGYSIRNQSI